MLFIGAILIGVAIIVMVSRRMPDELVPWGSDYSAALVTARKTNKPILLYFTASWCGPCQEMRRYVWGEPRVADAIKAYVPVRIDVDAQPQFAEQYKADQGIPLFVVVDAQGNELRRIVGAMPADDFLNWVVRK